MKKKFNLILLVFCLAQLLNWGCTREQSPTVTTLAVTEITQTTALAGGQILSNGAEVTVRGVCYSSTNEKPTVDDMHTIDGGGAGDYTTPLENLIPNTIYYVRAYAMNSQGVTYGNVVTFTTLDENDTISLTYRQMLCIPEGWKLSTAASSPAYELADGSLANDLINDGYLYNWELDDIIIFSESGSEIANPGTLIPQGPNWGPDYDKFPYSTSTLGSWHFDNEDDPQLIYMFIPFFEFNWWWNNNFPLTCELLSLTKNKFTIRVTFNNDNPDSIKGTYAFTLTYIPANS